MTVVQEFRNKWEQVRRPACPAGPGRPRRKQIGKHSETGLSSSPTADDEYASTPGSTSTPASAHITISAVDVSRKSRKRARGKEECEDSVEKEGSNKSCSPQPPQCLLGPPSAATSLWWSREPVSGNEGHFPKRVSNNITEIMQSFPVPMAESLSAGQGRPALGSSGSRLSLLPPPLLTSPPSPCDLPHFQSGHRGSAAYGSPSPQVYGVLEQQLLALGDLGSLMRARASCLSAGGSSGGTGTVASSSEGEASAGVVIGAATSSYLPHGLVAEPLSDSSIRLLQMGAPREEASSSCSSIAKSCAGLDFRSSAGSSFTSANLSTASGTHNFLSSGAALQQHAWPLKLHHGGGAVAGGAGGWSVGGSSGSIAALGVGGAAPLTWQLGSNLRLPPLRSAASLHPSATGCFLVP